MLGHLAREQVETSLCRILVGVLIHWQTVVHTVEHKRDDNHAHVFLNITMLRA